jgi:single-strand DNA-binding protein
MNDTNSVAIVGRLTRDVDLKYTASGKAVAEFSIAVNRSVKQGDKWEMVADFFDVALWDKAAESVAKFLVKGKQVAIVGEVKINATALQLLGGGDSHGNAPKDAPSASHAPADGFADDIPF